MWAERRFVAFDKTPLFYRYTPPPENGRGVLIAVHGLGEHGGRYRAFGEYLHGLGYGVILPDLRGFGLSGGPRASLRHFSDHHRDLDALCRWSEREHRDSKLYLLGHSLGGLIVASYAAQAKPPKLSGLVFSSPAFGTAAPVPPWKHALAAAASAIFPDHLEPSGIDTSRLTHDRAVMDVYRKDPLIFHRISARLYTEFCRLCAERRTIAARIRVPTLLLQAGEDAIVSKDLSLKFYDELGAADKTLEVLDGFYHEVLNETRRAEIFSSIGLWLNAH